MSMPNSSIKREPKFWAETFAGFRSMDFQENDRSSTPERRGNASPRTEEKVRRRVASASAETEEPAEPGHHLDIPFLHLLRLLQPHRAASSAANSLLQSLAAHLLCRAWRRTHEIRRKLIEEGKLAVILVANLGTGGSKPSALVRQKHIHTTVNHAGQRATFLIANEYGWGSNLGPGGSDDVESKLGLTLTTGLPTAPPPTLHGSPSSCWCYAAQEQVSGPETFPSKPGYESTKCQNFIATRHSGAFLLEKMSKNFYEDAGLPAQAYDGRFVCCKAKWVDKRHVDWPHAGAAAAAERQPSHLLLATWHGPHKDVLTSRLQCLEKLCSLLKSTCDASADDCLGCVLAGDFNLDFHQLELEKYVGFRRLDPDENVRPQSAGRWRNGNRQHDVDHMLFYQPPGSPLMARRPRRFRIYDRRRAGQDRRRAGLLPEGAGAVEHDVDGALDHDSLILELWLDGTTTLVARLEHSDKDVRQAAVETP